MSALFRDAAIETLRHPNMLMVNFEYGPTRVYPQGYRSVAKLIQDGHIRFVVTAGNSSFEVDTPRGQVHTFNVSDQIAETDARGEIRIRGRVLSAGTRGTIVHEATHALQDYQRLSAKLGNSFTPRMAEGAAYLAGWIAKLQWGYPRLQPDIDQRWTSHSYARWIAGKVLERQIVYRIPFDDINMLNRMVRTGSASRYVFDGI